MNVTFRERMPAPGRVEENEHDALSPSTAIVPTGRCLVPYLSLGHLLDRRDFRVVNNKKVTAIKHETR